MSHSYASHLMAPSSAPQSTSAAQHYPFEEQYTTFNGLPFDSTVINPSLQLKKQRCNLEQPVHPQCFTFKGVSLYDTSLLSWSLYCTAHQNPCKEQYTTFNGLLFDGTVVCPSL